MTIDMFYVFPFYYHVKIMIILDLEFIIYYDEKSMN